MKLTKKGIERKLPDIMSIVVVVIFIPCMHVFLH